MPKSCRTYWNALSQENVHLWTKVEGSNGKVEFYTLAIDDKSGDYTRLTRFLPGADTTSSGGKSHTYPEEVYIVSGSCMTMPSSNGSRVATMRAGLPENCMGLLKRTKAVLSWRSLSQVKRQQAEEAA